ncbi:MAG: hypothetical protein JXR59_08305 [Desulfuromonadaceae bacterium]|nr:hypothetical protein [Desulfuromonadaceae bacterium]
MTPQLIGLLSFALFSNLPLGYLRQGTMKRSAPWFLYIHLSIPFIIWLRLHLGLDWHVVPYSVLFAALGQIGGGRLRTGRDGS